MDAKGEILSKGDEVTVRYRPEMPHSEMVRENGLDGKKGKVIDVVSWKMEGCIPNAIYRVRVEEEEIWLRPEEVEKVASYKLQVANNGQEQKKVIKEAKEQLSLF